MSLLLYLVCFLSIICVEWCKYRDAQSEVKRKKRDKRHCNALQIKFDSFHHLETYNHHWYFRPTPDWANPNEQGGFFLWFRSKHASNRSLRDQISFCVMLPSQCAAWQLVWPPSLRERAPWLRFSLQFNPNHQADYFIYWKWTSIVFLKGESPGLCEQAKPRWYCEQHHMNCSNVISKAFQQLLISFQKAFFWGDALLCIRETVNSFNKITYKKKNPCCHLRIWCKKDAGKYSRLQTCSTL